MMNDFSRTKVDQFINDQISSVPHLEALLLIWNGRPKHWSAEEMGRSLYLSNEMAQRILEELAIRGLVTRVGENYVYQSDREEKDTLMQDLDTIYRRELVRVSGMIHSKASAAVLDFARAFRFKKD